MLRRSVLMVALAAGSVTVADAALAQFQQSVQLAPGVTFTVTELHRVPEKGVMELKFTVANETQDDVTLKQFGMTRYGLGNRLDNIAIVDFSGRKTYDIGEAAGCLCSTFRNGDGGLIRAGQQREFWAWYAMPPGTGIRRMAVQIPDQQPIMNIPVM